MANDAAVAIAISAGFIFVILFSFSSTLTPFTTVPASVVHYPQEFVNPHPHYPQDYVNRQQSVYNYYLDSPIISGDLESILTYVLRRGTYVETGEPLSDSAITALKNESAWNLSSASPPIWYYRSWDNLHNFQLIFSFEFRVWVIKPAL